MSTIAVIPLLVILLLIMFVVIQIAVEEYRENKAWEKRCKEEDEQSKTNQ